MEATQNPSVGAFNHHTMKSLSAFAFLVRIRTGWNGQIAALLIAFGFMFYAPQAASAAKYRLVTVADSDGPLKNFGYPIFSPSGVMAFTAETQAGTRGIYTSSGGTPILVVQANGSPYYSGFGTPSINSGGTIVATASTSVSGYTTGAYRLTGANAGIVVPNSIAGLDAFATVEINASGDIAFPAYFGGPSGISLTSGGIPFNVATTASPSLFFNFGGDQVAFSDGGTAYFLAQTTDVDGFQIFSVTATSAPISLVKSDAASQFANLNIPLCNGNGVVIFTGFPKAGGSGVYRLNGGSPSAVAKSGTSATGFSGVYALAISNAGKVIFGGDPNQGSSGIFDGPNSTANKVVQRGDIIDGKTITRLNSFYKCVDGLGRVAFQYEAGSKLGIGLAIPDGVVEPAPEPEGVPTVKSSSKAEVPGAGDVGSRWTDGAVWGDFGAPSIDDAGTLAYVGRITLPRGGTGPRSGIFRQANGAATVVAAVGDAVGAVAGMEFSSFGDPLLASDGGLLFEATLRPAGQTSGTQKALFWQPSAGVALQLITQAGGEVNGTNGAVIASWSGIALRSGGHVGLRGKLKPGKTPAISGANDEIAAVWSPGGALQLALAEGQNLAGSKVKRFQMFTAGAAATGQDQSWFGVWPGETGGRIMPVVTLLDRRSLFGSAGAAANSLQTLAGTGPLGPGLPSLPAGTTLASIALPNFAPAAKAVVFRATLSDRSSHIYRKIAADSSSTRVATAGDFIGPNGAMISSFGDPICSPDANDILWMGQVAVPGPKGFKKVTALQAWKSGTLRIVAQSGEHAEGTETAAEWKSFQQIALTPDGRVIVIASLSGVNGKIDQGLWIADAAGALHLLVREGQTIGNSKVKNFSTLRAVNGQFGVARSFNSHGRIAVLINTADGLEHVATVQVP